MFLPDGSGSGEVPGQVGFPELVSTLFSYKHMSSLHLVTLAQFNLLTLSRFTSTFYTVDRSPF